MTRSWHETKRVMAELGCGRQGTARSRGHNCLARLDIQALAQAVEVRAKICLLLATQMQRKGSGGRCDGTPREVGRIAWKGRFTSTCLHHLHSKALFPRWRPPLEREKRARNADGNSTISCRTPCRVSGELLGAGCAIPKMPRMRCKTPCCWRSGISGGSTGAPRC